jgi:hypothetical protein
MNKKKKKEIKRKIRRRELKEKMEKKFIRVKTMKKDNRIKGKKLMRTTPKRSINRVMRINLSL